MKTTKYILFALAILGLATSCHDSDWDVPSPQDTVGSYGNKYIQPTNVKTIAELKALYSNEINNNSLKQVTKPLQIIGLVNGNDEGGNIYQSIYVQYFTTDGSEANYPDAVGSQMRTVGKVYASGQGRVTNISNNVTFLFESSIHGGTDFEAKDSIKRNAKIYFASNAKLITLPDFMSYLLTITDPISVKHAIAYGENQIEDQLGEHDAGRTNLIMYCLFSDIYRETNGLYRPINVFDESEDLSSSSLYIDYSAYMSHLFDYVSFLLYPKGTTQDQYNDRSTFGQWALQVRADAEDRMMINTKLISMPPLFHYYDCVGDIQVDRHVDLAKFKEELENDLYKWLAENTTFKSQIFKSDIYNQILKHAGAKRLRRTRTSS